MLGRVGRFGANNQCGNLFFDARCDGVNRNRTATKRPSQAHKRKRVSGC